MNRHLPYVDSDYRSGLSRAIILVIEVKDPAPHQRTKYEAEVASRSLSFVGEPKREPFTVSISGYGTMTLEHARAYLTLLDAAVHLCDRLNLHPTMPHGLPSPWLEVTVVKRNFKARTAYRQDKDRMNKWPETSENDPDKPWAVRRPVLDSDGHLLDFAWSLHATEEEASAAAKT